MVVRKLNYKKLIVALVILITLISLIVFGIVKLSNYLSYKKTYEYKLVQIGYNLDESKVIINKLSNSDLDKVLLNKYNENLSKYCETKYFLYKNLDKYIEYEKTSDEEDLNEIVKIINTGVNEEWLDVEYETDTSKNELMLVNRYYGLSSDYEPDDIINVDSAYAYSGVYISESIMDDIIELINAAKEEGYTFVLSDGYRSYKKQEEIYNNYKNSWGISEADTYVARAGHSEYQTGLAFIIVPFNKVLDKPEESEEYKWLKENAYKYGFIFRYTADNKDVTLFEPSTWRLRYVGIEASTIIDNNNLSFEEYYAYFVDNE